MPWLMTIKQEGLGFQILQSLSCSRFLGITNGKVASVTNIPAMYCETQHSVVRMTGRLTFSGGMMGLLMIRALLCQDP